MHTIIRAKSMSTKLDWRSRKLPNSSLVSEHLQLEARNLPQTFGRPSQTLPEGIFPPNRRGKADPSAQLIDTLISNPYMRCICGHPNASSTPNLSMGG